MKLLKSTPSHLPAVYIDGDSATNTRSCPDVLNFADRHCPDCGSWQDGGCARNCVEHLQASITPVFSFPYKRFRSIAGCAVLLLSACGQFFAPSKAAIGFTVVKLMVTSPADAETAMGPPTSKNVTDIPGARLEVWAYEDRRARYELRFADTSLIEVGGPRLISKSIELKAP